MARDGQGRAQDRQRGSQIWLQGAKDPNPQVDTKFLLQTLRTWGLSRPCCLWLISSENRGVTRNLGGELEVAKETFPPIFLSWKLGQREVFPYS